MPQYPWYVKTDQWGEGVCCIPGCYTPISARSETPVCGACGLRLARYYREVIIHEEDQRRAASSQEREQKKPAEMRWEGRHVVYYVRIGDYIKIGTTKRLRQRISSLRAPLDDLLAIEDGDHLLEARRHREFAADRIDRRRENFRPSGALLAHIKELGGRDSLPSWARQLDTSVVRVRWDEYPLQ